MSGLFILVTALVSGIFAGMGMGGGTFLIPALSIFFDYNQTVCQSTNVICFIVLGLICLYVYSKNKLIDYKVTLFVSIPACIISVVFTIFSIKVNSSILQFTFALFIIGFGIFYFVSSIIKIVKHHKKK